MEPDTAQTPLIKQLASSNRQERDKAFELLRTYLLSGRNFTHIELMKMWKGLFFCMHHTPPPLPAQRLAQSYATLLLDMPPNLFMTFLTAFWATMIAYWDSIPSLRLDKYLYLTRLYISHSFLYLARQNWKSTLVEEWTGIMTGTKGEATGPLAVDDGKVGDGLRYHVLDVWTDGLVATDSWPTGIERGILRPVRVVQGKGIGKVLRQRAADVLEDERLLKESPAEQLPATIDRVKNDDEFEGFED